MLLFLIYFFISPLVYLCLLLIYPFNPKIRILLKNQKKIIHNLKDKINKKNINKKIVIIHAASAGEYEQIKPLLRSIDKDIFFVIVTCMSPTIYQAIKNDKLADELCYHPFDFPWEARNFLKFINPDLYITTRHDVWPIHLYYAQKMKIKTIIVNANLYISSKRLEWYFINFTCYIYNLFDLIIVPSISIKKIFESKLNIYNTVHINDTRYEQILYRKKHSNDIGELNSIINKKNIIFGSITLNDLKLFDNYFLSEIYKKQFNWIIIVPHELDEILIKKIKNIFPESIKFSEIKNYNFNDYGCLIVDKVGILPELYKYSKIAYVGGGFDNGVHSTIEPLVYKNLVCYGPNYDLLDEAREMLENNLGVIIKNSEDIYNLSSNLINDNKIINFISDKNNSSKIICDKINEIL